MMSLEEKRVLAQSCAHFQAQPDRRDSALSLTLPNENNQLDERIYIAKPRCRCIFVLKCCGNDTGYPGRLVYIFEPQFLIVTQGGAVVKKFIAMAAAIAAFGFVGSASAADMPSKAPAPMVAPMYNWSGWYVGLNAGAAVDPARFNTDPVFSPTGYFAATSTPAISATASQTVHTPGFTGGIQFGYNWQMNNTVFGIETDFDYLGLKGSTTNSALYPCCAPTTFTINQSVKTDWMWTLRPRLGWASNNWLFYITGGLAVTQIKANFLFTDTFATANESASISRTKAGWALGGGVEYGVLGGPWSVKAEYLHVDFGSVSTTSTNLTAFTPPIPFPTNVFTHSVKLSDDIIRVGLNYKVGP